MENKSDVLRFFGIYTHNFNSKEVSCKCYNKIGMKAVLDKLKITLQKVKY